MFANKRMNTKWNLNQKGISEATLGFKGYKSSRYKNVAGPSGGAYQSRVTDNCSALCAPSRFQIEENLTFEVRRDFY